MYLFLFLTLYMFRAHRAPHQERQILPICTRYGHRHIVTAEVILTQFFSPDDERDVLETCRELKIKVNT
jgi:hypothetical protein